ncbi:MAG: hypothetical protein AAGA54_20030 [Myxococcota bacterium]
MVKAPLVLGVVFCVVACGDATESDGMTDSPTTGMISTSGGSEASSADSTSGGSPTTSGSSPTTSSSDTDMTTGGETDGSCPPPQGDPAPPTECAANCGSSNLDLEHISAVNYAGSVVHQLSPACAGSACPAPLDQGSYGAVPIGRCEDSAEALASPRGPEAYCRFAPVALAFGFEVGFTTPPLPDSISRTRPRLDDGQPEEFAWHTRILQVEGPTTRYAGVWRNGTAEAPDTAVGRNLTCIENLEALGIDFDPEDLDAVCSATFDGDGGPTPLRMMAQGVFYPTEGQLESRSLSCSTPVDGPDTCCSSCDEQLAVRVARYGADAEGARRSPNDATAIECDPDADPLLTCRDFLADVDRSGEIIRHRYEWEGCTADWPLTLNDRLRELHPDDRPSDIEPTFGACEFTEECEDGQVCIGTNASGAACLAGSGLNGDGGDCQDGVCRLEWFGGCRRTNAGSDYCVDRRFREIGTAACFAGTVEFEAAGQSFPATTRIAQCDLDENGRIDAGNEAEACCQDALGNERSCDPLFQTNVEPVARFDRDAELPPTAQCVCEDDAPDACTSLVEDACEPPVGDGESPEDAASIDAYAFQAVRRRGGVRFADDLNGFDLRLGYAGQQERARPEACAEIRATISGRGPSETWLANASIVPSLDRDYNVALCSDSTYDFVFAGPDDPEHVRTSDGDTLAGKQRYSVSTSAFLVTPGSGFPTDNLNISACDDFTLRLSNAYDLSAENLRKPELWQVEDMDGDAVATTLIAGGPDCDPTATAADVTMGAIPCLVVDVGDVQIGRLSVQLDPTQFPDVLLVGSRYRIVLPGLEDSAEISDPDAYRAAFHDACGMPLITGDLPEAEYVYDFTIDSPCN